MSSLTITTRQAKDGPRYAVRYRLGGRAYPIVHGGSFKTLKEAKTRRDLIAGELAAGRNPRVLLDAIGAAPAVVRTLNDWATEYRASRVDLASVTALNLSSHLKTVLATFGERTPNGITTADIQRWIIGLNLKPSTVRRYLLALRGL